MKNCETVSKNCEIKKEIRVTGKNCAATEMKQTAEIFSQEPENSDGKVPFRVLRTSFDAGWTSLFVKTFENSANVEPFDCPVFDAQTVAVCLKGETEIASFSGGIWRTAHCRPGMGGMTPAGKADRLRLSSKVNDTLVMTKILIPQIFFTIAIEEFRRAGTKFRTEPLNALSFNDPTVYQIALSINNAIQIGAPNLYAESAAQFLATHLLSLHSSWSAQVFNDRKSGELHDRRLDRVLDFMTHNFAEDLSLDELAREAGISRFHFINLFKKKCGITPHQHLIKLRMESAAQFLEFSDLSLKEIGVRCGYQNAAHFSTAFHKYFHQTPMDYRNKIEI